MLKIGVPSKGRLQELTFQWFGAQGVTMRQTGNDREYSGAVDGIEGVELVLLDHAEGRGFCAGGDVAAVRRSVLEDGGAAGQAARVAGARRGECVRDAARRAAWRRRQGRGGSCRGQDRPWSGGMTGAPSIGSTGLGTGCATCCLA